MSRRNTVCGPHVGLHVCSACAMPREGRIRAAALRGSRDNSPPFTTGQMQVEGSHHLPKVTQRLSSRAGRQHPTPVSGQCSLVSLLEAPHPHGPSPTWICPPRRPRSLPLCCLLSAAGAHSGGPGSRHARPSEVWGGGAWPGSGAWRCSTSRRGHQRRGAGPFTPPAALRVRARSAGPP